MRKIVDSNYGQSVRSFSPDTLYALDNGELVIVGYYERQLAGDDEAAAANLADYRYRSFSDASENHGFVRRWIAVNAAALAPLPPR